MLLFTPDSIQALKASKKLLENHQTDLTYVDNKLVDVADYLESMLASSVHAEMGNLQVAINTHLQDLTWLEKALSTAIQAERDINQSFELKIAELKTSLSKKQEQLKSKADNLNEIDLQIDELNEVTDEENEKLQKLKRQRQNGFASYRKLENDILKDDAVIQDIEKLAEAFKFEGTSSEKKNEKLVEIYNLVNRAVCLLYQTKAQLTTANNKMNRRFAEIMQNVGASRVVDIPLAIASNVKNAYSELAGKTTEGSSQDFKILIQQVEFLSSIRPSNTQPLLQENLHHAKLILNNFRIKQTDEKEAVKQFVTIINSQLNFIEKFNMMVNQVKTSQNQSRDTRHDLSSSDHDNQDNKPDMLAVIIKKFDAQARYLAGLKSKHEFVGKISEQYLASKALQLELMSLVNLKVKHRKEIKEQLHTNLTDTAKLFKSCRPSNYHLKRFIRAASKIVSGGNFAAFDEELNTYKEMVKFNKDLRQELAMLIPGNLRFATTTAQLSYELEPEYLKRDLQDRLQTSLAKESDDNIAAMKNATTESFKGEFNLPVETPANSEQQKPTLIQVLH